jgi:hypothetical protein
MHIAKHAADNITALRQIADHAPIQREDLLALRELCCECSDIRAYRKEVLAAYESLDAALSLYENIGYGALCDWQLMRAADILTSVAKLETHIPG